MFKHTLKIFKYFKKKFKPYEAQTICKFNINYINENLLSLKRPQKINKNEKFYIIRRTPGAGLFSNLIYILNHIKIADSCGLKPVVDMENFLTIYNEKKKIEGSNNSWNYYFENNQNYNLNKIYKENIFFLTSNRFSKNFSHSIDSQEYRKLFKKYFKIKKKYINYVNFFHNKYFSREKVLALHLRGTSYKTSANHPLPITLVQSENLIEKLMSKYKFSKIFLCTEDLNYLDNIKKRFGKKIIYLKQSYRSYKDDAFKIYPRNNHRFKLGEEILIESLLISRCNSFAFTNSNVSEFVKFLDKNKKIKYFLIENGFNSSNEYIAKWYWYYKNIIPSVLGGFKDTTNVKNI